MRRTTRTDRQAFHDALTGLPNRALFRDRVEQALRVARREGGAVAVMVVGLDRFAELNDTLGDRRGDELLVAAGRELGRPLRTCDTIARLGGDEFGILLPLVKDAAGALALAERLRAELARAHLVADAEVDVEASVGIALYPQDGEDVDTLIRRADAAMHVSRETRAPALATSVDDHSSAQRLALIFQLRRAVAQRELAVYYQPQADLRSGRVRSVEALVRWHHPEHGLLMPGAFVPLAEQTSLIRALTSHVLATALGQCWAWREEGLDLGVAVNVTGRDVLDPRFPDEVEQHLRRWDLDPSRLQLELAERSVPTDMPRAREVLARLGELGVRLAIDDVGTDSSSLDLEQLPVDVLKLHKSLVLHMVARADDAAIVRATIERGHDLGLEVVADGVDTDDVRSRLQALGCDVVQGYFLSRPVPASEIPALLAGSASTRRIRLLET